MSARDSLLAAGASGGMEVDVLVVGGGPAGATAAAFLAMSGRSVLLLEKRREGEGKVCGEFVGSEATPVLHRLGILQSLEDAGALPILTARLRTGAGARLDVPLPMGGPRPGFALSRTALDSLLIETARSRGARVLRSAAVTRLSGADRDGRRAAFRVGGRTLRIGARVVIGADGRDSKVARLAGLGGRFSAPRLGLQLHLHRRTPPPAWVELLMMEDAYAGWAPVEGDRWCLGALTAASFASGVDPWNRLLSFCRRQAAAGEPLGEPGERLSRQAVFPVRMGLRSCTAPRLLLAGDAAGVVDPFCGQGIALALITGAEAAAAADTILNRPEGDGVERRRYESFLRRQVLSRLLACGPLRPLVHRPRWAGSLLKHLNRRPWAARGLVALARNGTVHLPSAIPRILGRLLFS